MSCQARFGRALGHASHLVVHDRSPRHQRHAPSQTHSYNASSSSRVRTKRAPRTPVEAARMNSSPALTCRDRTPPSSLPTTKCRDAAAYKVVIPGDNRLLRQHAHSPAMSIRRVGVSRAVQSRYAAALHERHGFCFSHVAHASQLQPCKTTPASAKQVPSALPYVKHAHDLRLILDSLLARFESPTGRLQCLS